MAANWFRQSFGIALSKLPAADGIAASRVERAPTAERLSFRAAFLFLLIPPAIILSLHPDLFFSPPGVDAWVYLGFFRNLVNFKRDLFVSTYYGSRLSWILPGFLAHHIFPPTAAAFLLHLFVYVTAVCSFFYVLRVTAHTRAALLATLGFSSYAFFWAAVGWDYVDGIGIAYYLLTTAFLTRAASRERATAWLIAAGGAYAATVYSNLGWAVLAPVIAVHYFWMKYSGERAHSVKAWIRAVSFFVLGAGGMTAVLGGVNYFIEGRFWFYLPSIGFALTSVRSRNPWYHGITDHGILVVWLWLPALVLFVGLLSSLVLLISQSKSASQPALMFFFEFLLSLGIFGCMQYAGSAPLGVYFYASYLIPVTFLAFATLFWASTSTFGRNFWLVAFSSAVLFLLPWILPNSGRVLRSIKSEAPTVGLVSGVVLAAAVALRKWRWSIVAPSISLSLIAGVVTDNTAADGNRSMYERVMSARSTVESIRNDAPIRWWYDPNDPNANDFLSLTSTYLWGYTLVAGAFPEFSAKNILVPENLLCVTTSLPDSASVATAKLQEVLKPRGQTALLKANQTFSGSGKPYKLLIFQIEDDPTTMQALSVQYNATTRYGLLAVGAKQTAETFPGSAWTLSSYPGAEGALSATPSGLDIITPRITQAYATMYPILSAPVDGTYRFALRVKQVSGQITFGMLSGDQAHWITSTSIVIKPGFTKTIRFDVALKKDETFHLLTANFQPSNQASRYIIEDLRGYLIQK